MDNLTKIIKLEGQRPDLELAKDCPFIGQLLGYATFSISSDEASSSISQEGEPPAIESTAIFGPMENRGQSNSSLTNDNIPPRPKVNGQPTIPIIQEPDIEAQQSSQSQFVVDERPKIKKRGKTYPTNNLLPRARGPHVQFLMEKLKEKIGSHTIINRLKNANTANREDFLKLYTIPEFYDAFDYFFKNKVLYRAILVSGGDMENKKVFLNRLHIFQEAYRSKVFNVVNRKGNRVSRKEFYRQL